MSVGAKVRGQLARHAPRLEEAVVRPQRLRPGAPDEVRNARLFVSSTDGRGRGGPLAYGPRTHPLGDRRTVPEHDEHRRSRDNQMARIVPEGEWRIPAGPPGTIVYP